MNHHDSQVVQADCLDHLRTLADASIDSIVTDPPYGLTAKKGGTGGGFMGLAWDSSIPTVEIWAECLRVLKPGGHLLAFAGTRTQHRMAVAIEDGGFEIRDMIAWVYGQGFPKAHDVSKSIASEFPVTDDAKLWAGWKSAIKPAMEPITVARKPLDGTIAANVLTHGTGALNIDGCRVESSDNLNGGAYANDGGRSESPSLHGGSGMNQPGKTVGRDFQQPSGRFPANLIHDGSDDVLAAFPNARGQQGAVMGDEPSAVMGATNCFGKMNRSRDTPYIPRIEQDKSAARFFYAAKASKAERGEGNGHPTVKPVALMRYLVRLVTPPGGLVLDPFAGSGTTGIAAALEGFRFLGIEREAEYCEIARRRIAMAGSIADKR